MKINAKTVTDYCTRVGKDLHHQVTFEDLLALNDATAAAATTGDEADPPAPAKGKGKK